MIDLIWIFIEAYDKTISDLRKFGGGRAWVGLLKIAGGLLLLWLFCLLFLFILG